MAYDVWQSCMLIDIGLNKSECASWVQAWGSIGAIAGSFLLAKLTDRKAKQSLVTTAKLNAQLEMIPLASRLRISAEIFSTLHKDCSKLPAAESSVKVVSEMLRRVFLPGADCIQVIASVDVECAKALSIAVESLRQLKSHIEVELRYKGDPSEFHWASIVGLLSYLDVNTNEASSRVEKFLESQGVPLDKR